MPARCLPRISDVDWIANTVIMEAGGEPWEGQLAVAWVVVRRAKSRAQSISDVVLAPWQFSAWNTDSPTRARLDNTNDEGWASAYRAACAAYFDLAPDPTGGATFYLNVDTVLRVAGRLPKWARDPDNPKIADERRVTARIGAHTFMKD